MKQTLQPSERQIQQSILEWLELNQIFAWRQNTGTLGIDDHRRKSGKRIVRFATPGCADIIGIVSDRNWVQEWKQASGSPHAHLPYPSMVHGRFLAIEVKGPRGRLSAAQQSFKEAVERSGGIYILAGRLQDVIDVLGG